MLRKTLITLSAIATLGLGSTAIAKHSRSHGGKHGSGYSGSAYGGGGYGGGYGGGGYIGGGPDGM